MNAEHIKVLRDLHKDYINYADYYNAAGDIDKASTLAEIRDALAAAIKMAEDCGELVEASLKLGSWMSAAIDDPTACAEFKLAASEFVEVLAKFGGES